MSLRLFLPAVAAGNALLCGQTPTAPIISAPGVTNFFTQEPAPGVVGLGGLVQIVGLNLGPPEGITATDTPWPTRLGDTQVTIGGKAAPLYAVTPGTIIAQVQLDANTGLVNVVVRRASGNNSTPAKVTVAPMASSVRTADDSGAALPLGKITTDSISMAAGLGPTDPN